MLLVIISLLALLVVAVTMLFSAADLKLKGARWNVRRVAFILAGTGAVGLMLHMLLGHYHPNREQVALHVGIALQLMTNPFQIPWHRWVWRGNAGGVT